MSMYISEKSLVLALIGILLFVGTVGAEPVWMIAPEILPAIPSHDFSAGAPVMSFSVAAFEQSPVVVFDDNLFPNQPYTNGVSEGLFPVFSSTQLPEFIGPDPIDNPKAYPKAPSGARYISCIF